MINHLGRAEAEAVSKTGQFELIPGSPSITLLHPEVPIHKNTCVLKKIT